MKKEVVIVGIVIVVVFFMFGFFKFTGFVVDEFGGGDIGPSAADLKCMQNCVAIGCEMGDESCAIQNSEKCGKQCGVETSGPVAADEGEACMQECVVNGCSEFDFDCQNSKRNSCENECGMKGDAPDESEMSEEQRCITECVNKVDASIICGSGTYEGEGETGNSVCQKCAAECVHLYEGPCLTDELWREKEDDCMALGEHMEAMPVKGDSGEGYECTVDLECVDRSNEFGDEPGSGPGIGQEGYKEPGVITKVFEGIGNFFKGLFGGEEE